MPAAAVRRLTTRSAERAVKGLAGDVGLRQLVDQAVKNLTVPCPC